MKKIVSIVLLACLLCGVFAGCKAKKQANSATDVEVVYWEAGNGRAWLDKIVKAFNDSQDQYHATVVSSAENRTGEFIHGDATGDLYIGTFNNCNAYKEYLYPLDDFLATKLDGEDGLTVGEKLGKFAQKNTTSDGHVYAIPDPIGNINTIMYNVDKMVDVNGNPYKLPNTTDELIKLCLSLYSDGITPFVHYHDYWHYVYEGWIAQYEGEDKYYDIWNGIYTDENGVKHENDVRCITESQGRFEAYKVLEELLSPKGYTYTNTNSFSHTNAQTYFLSGYAAMQPNGSWIENEMGGGEAASNVLPMRLPVLSAVGEKLGIRSDKHLSLIVDYVDGTALSDAEMAVVNSYSQEVIEEVRKARAVNYGAQPGHVLIPNYSNCIDGALELMKFIYSDEGLKMACDTNGVPSAYKFSGEVELDTSEWTPFMQECNKIMTTSSRISVYLNRPIYYMTGIDHLAINSACQSMTYRADGGIMTAEEYWSKETADWEAKWPQMLIDAGLQ